MTTMTDRLVATAKAVDPPVENKNHWVLVNADGREANDGEGVPHFLNEAQAIADAPRLAQTPTETLTPRQLDQPCQSIACSCCGYVFNEDEDGFCCYDTQDEADADAKSAGWKIGDDDAPRCEYCVGGECEDCRPASGEESVQ